MTKKIAKIPQALSIFTLAMINVAAVTSVKVWPFTAEYGFSSLFYFILAAVIFFIPVSLVSAELATGWPKKGGIYLWVKEAFGPKWGFLAVWLQWIENVVWYPTVLSFAAGTIAYLINPDLSNSFYYTTAAILIFFWGATIANLFGMKTSGWISNIGAICGTLIPAAIIIPLAIFWVSSDAPIQIEFTLKSLIPNFDINHMVLFSGVMLAFCGMEMSAVHALDVQNPQKGYPRAILLSTILILTLSILGALSIAIVVPNGEINYTAGAMQAFTVFLTKYNLKVLIPAIAIMITVGLFGTVSTWIIGPTKGVLAAAEEGHLPPIFQKTNKKNAPIGLMIFQAILVSFLTLMFVFMPSVTAAFWILTVLAAQYYVIMYVIMFAAAIYLRYKKPDVERSYRVPGKNFGMWLVCGIGTIGSLFALYVGFFPPAQIETGNRIFYVGFLIVGNLIGCLAPFGVVLFQKDSWFKNKSTEATK